MAHDETTIHYFDQLVYDVFLTFNESDTGNSFATNLVNALRRKRFKTFMEKDGIQIGDHIPSITLEALRASKIAIVVLSKNFAASAFCLDEVEMIIDCAKGTNQRVLPVFYDVDPSEVVYQTSKFSNNFASHLHRSKYKLERWEYALHRVGCFKGWHFEKRDFQKCENQVIQEIVEFVSKTLPRYDVSLCFNQDTRYSFTGYLYNAMDREGFKIFMKNTEEEIKDKSSHSLIATLEKSRLSIIILSKDFAYSSSCLDELVTVLEFVKNNKLLVWPIFYKVEPSDVRHQKNSYEKAMDEHENKYGKDSEKVKIWRSALLQVANLKGWHFKYGYEYELIQKIVEIAIKI